MCDFQPSLSSDVSQDDSLNSANTCFLGSDNQVHSSLTINGKCPYKPEEKFIYNFKPEWDDYFQKIDDYCIRIAQHFHLRKKDDDSILNKVLGSLFLAVAFVVTFVSRVENTSSICLFLIALGYDHLGRWITLIGIIASLAAQFPKRFLFRKRPFMAKRALQSSKLETSSFPSRAVTCAVVYAFTAIIAYNYQVKIADDEPSRGISVIGAILIIFGAFLASSLARIHLGAHYASDCIGGAILGLLICFTSWALFQLPNIFGCPSCYADQCYPTQIEHMMNTTNFHPQNIGLSISVMFVVGVFLVLSNCPPLVFWNKAAPIFGTFCACIIAEIMMACPKDHSKGLVQQDYNNLTFVNYLVAFLLSAGQLVVAQVASKLHRRTRKFSLLKSTICNIFVYLFFVVGFLFAIIKVRLI